MKSFFANLRLQSPKLFTVSHTHNLQCLTRTVNGTRGCLRKGVSTLDVGSSFTIVTSIPAGCQGVGIPARIVATKSANDSQRALSHVKIYVT